MPGRDLCMRAILPKSRVFLRHHIEIRGDKATMFYFISCFSLPEPRERSGKLLGNKTIIRFATVSCDNIICYPSILVPLIHPSINQNFPRHLSIERRLVVFCTMLANAQDKVVQTPSAGSSARLTTLALCCTTPHSKT